MSNDQKIVFEVYGGESVSNNIVVYAILIVRAELNNQLESEIVDLKGENGGIATDDLHCRILFNGHLRAKSPWAHMSLDNVFSLS